MKERNDEKANVDHFIIIIDLISFDETKLAKGSRRMQFMYVCMCIYVRVRISVYVCMCMHICVCMYYAYVFVCNRPIGQVGRVFANAPGDRGSIPGRIIPKTQKWYLRFSSLTLSIIRCGLRVKWSNRGKGVAPPLHFGVVAMEKGANVSSTTTVANKRFVCIYVSMYASVCMGVGMCVCICINVYE